MAFKTKLRFSALHIIKRLGIFPLHLNMFKFSDVEELIANKNFDIVKAEKIFYGMTLSFIVARKK